MVSVPDGEFEAPLAQLLKAGVLEHQGAVPRGAAALAAHRRLLGLGRLAAALLRQEDAEGGRRGRLRTGFGADK